MAFLDLPHVRLNYVSMGPKELTAGDDAPPFLLVHGLAANLAFWYTRIAPALARWHRVVMFDLRGHGRSSSPLSGYGADHMAGDAEALLDQLGIDQVHLVGHSFGGNVTLQLACRCPERVASLTMADVRVRSVQPRLDLGAWDAWPRLRAHLQLVGIEIDETADEVGFYLLEQLARLRLDQPAGVEQARVLGLSPFAGGGGEAVARQWLKLLDSSTVRDDFLHGAGVPLDRLETLAVPTLLLYGEHSQALPTARALARLLPDAHLEIVPGVGHFFPGKQPERFVDAVTSFIGADRMPALAAAAL